MNDKIDITLSKTDNSFKKYIPILTAICCFTSIVLFIGINLEGKLDNWEVYKKWGSPSANQHVLPKWGLENIGSSSVFNLSLVQLLG